MIRLLLCLLTTVAVFALPTLSVAKDVYVSQDGNDANTGAQDQPFATLAKAVATMRGAGPGTIWIGDGEFFVEDGLLVDSKCGGTAEQPLTIRAIHPRKARLTGARVVGGLRSITAEEAQPLISSTAKKKVIVADLKGQNFPPLRELPKQYRAPGREEVVFGDQPLQPARWPNDEFAVFTEVIDAGASKPTHWVQRDVYRPGSFKFPNTRPAKWNFERGIWLHGFWCYDWSDEALLAESYEPKSRELRLAVKHGYGIGSPWKKDSKRRFYAVNVFEELDAPGEYYLDRRNNLLFLWPPGDIKSTPVRLTLSRNPLLRADGVKHLVIRDLIVENGCSSGIEFRNCESSVVQDCLVRNTGRSGITLSGTQVSAIGCEVTATASYGISISGGDRKTLTPGKCSVENCHIHHIGRLDWQSGRGIIVNGCGNRVANNLIHHGPTGAVQYGGNEQTVELNETHHMCIHYSDVGVFYTGRDWSSQGNVVRWNYIHDNTNNEGHGSSAIYLDDCDSGDVVFQNIVLGGVGRGILLGGGRDNTIEGNIFVDLPIGIHVDARGPRGITLDKPGSWNLLAKCEKVDYLSPLWKQRYPRLAATMDNNPLLPMGNAMRNNFIVGCEKPWSLSRDVKAEWLDRSNNLELKLADVPVLDRWKSTGKIDLVELSTLWKQLPEFEPIPVERIGLKR